MSFTLSKMSSGDENPAPVDKKAYWNKYWTENKDKIKAKRAEKYKARTDRFKVIDMTKVEEYNGIMEQIRVLKQSAKKFSNDVRTYNRRRRNVSTEVVEIDGGQN